MPELLQNSVVLWYWQLSYFSNSRAQSCLLACDWRGWVPNFTDAVAILRLAFSHAHLAFVYTLSALEPYYIHVINCALFLTQNRKVYNSI